VLEENQRQATLAAAGVAVCVVDTVGGTDQLVRKLRISISHCCSPSPFLLNSRTFLTQANVTMSDIGREEMPSVEIELAVLDGVGPSWRGLSGAARRSGATVGSLWM
jgi:hypothetical protein